MTTAVGEKQTYRPEDLLRMPDGHRYDLVDGVLTERQMGSISSWVGGVLYATILEFSRLNHLGWVWHADAGFQCFPRRGQVRYPDVAFVRYGRLPGEQLPEGHIDIPPDLVAEVVSPNDLVDDLEARVADYLAAGVHLVWVIHPQQRHARVHRPDLTIFHVGTDDLLDGETVLPGFRVRLLDLFPTPPAPPSNPQAP
jgi:Uma2 family endonuclease